MSLCDMLGLALLHALKCLCDTTPPDKRVIVMRVVDTFIEDFCHVQSDLDFTMKLRKRI